MSVMCSKVLVEIKLPLIGGGADCMKILKDHSCPCNELVSLKSRQNFVAKGGKRPIVEGKPQCFQYFSGFEEDVIFNLCLGIVAEVVHSFLRTHSVQHAKDETSAPVANVLLEVIAHKDYLSQSLRYTEHIGWGFDVINLPCAEGNTFPVNGEHERVVVLEKKRNTDIFATDFFA